LGGGLDKKLEQEHGFFSPYTTLDIAEDGFGSENDEKMMDSPVVGA